jgi:hypothetical protein
MDQWRSGTLSESLAHSFPIPFVFNLISRSLRLCARWTIFVTPLESVVQFSGHEPGPFRGCVLCCSRDGTIAVIAVDGFEL